MSHSLQDSEMQTQIDSYVQNYTQDELWSILELEWKKAQVKVSPKRSSDIARPQIEKFILELKEKIKINQALLPSSASAMTGFLISQIEVSYPWIIQFKIPLSILVALIIQSLQSTWLSENKPASSKPEAN